MIVMLIGHKCLIRKGKLMIDDAKECLELVDDALNEFDKCETDSSET